MKKNNEMKCKWLTKIYRIKMSCNTLDIVVKIN